MHLCVHITWLDIILKLFLNWVFHETIHKLSISVHRPSVHLHRCPSATRVPTQTPTKALQSWGCWHGQGPTLQPPQTPWAWPLQRHRYRRGTNGFHRAKPPRHQPHKYDTMTNYCNFHLKTWCQSYNSTVIYVRLMQHPSKTCINGIIPFKDKDKDRQKNLFLTWMS